MAEKEKKPRTPKQIETAKKNLKPRCLSSEQASEIGKKGAKAKAEKKAEEQEVQKFATRAIAIIKKRMEEGDSKDIEDLPALTKDNIEEANLTIQDRMVMKMVNEALKGNVRAFETIVKLTGETLDRHEINAVVEEKPNKKKTLEVVQQYREMMGKRE